MLSKNGIEYLSSPLLSAFSVAHGFLSRQGGVSRHPFNSLNLDPRDGDSPGNIERNRGLIKNAFSIPVEALATVNQVHGNAVYVADVKVPQRRPDADAVVTAVKGVPVGVLTADCLPVLLYDPKAHAAAAVHAGWRGTVKKVCLKAIESMRERFGSDPKDMIAALGPYIGPCCYEVRENVAEEFTYTFGPRLKYIIKNGKGIRLDIGMANLEQLICAGVGRGNIDMDAPCTSCNNSSFFSYRKEGGRTGRQLSFIMLK